jgi:hypothetical protein
MDRYSDRKRILPQMNSSMSIAGIIIAITGAILGINQVIIPLWKKGKMLFSTWADFVRDWNGEPAAPGRAEVPGVMQRLNKLDGELSNNGGSSLKDAVDRLEVSHKVLYNKLEDAEKQRAESQAVILEAIKAIAASQKPTKARTTKAKTDGSLALKSVDPEL